MSKEIGDLDFTEKISNLYISDNFFEVVQDAIDKIEVNTSQEAEQIIEDAVNLILNPDIDLYKT